MKTRSDLQTGRYSVQLTTLYDSNQRHSFIMNEVASAHTLRYIQVPERRVDISPTTMARTTKLFILDVKPRSMTKAAGARLVTAYGVDDMELTLPEEPSLDKLRSKFETRPGRLSNARMAQPEAVAHLVIGRDNQAHMPVVALRSVKRGSDLYIMRNDLFAGEMLFGETDKSGPMKKEAAGGSKSTSTPKPRQLKARNPPIASKRPEKAAPVQIPPIASKRREKAAPVQTPSIASKRPETAAEERPVAGSSGIKSRRRQDSSPAMSVAASDSMMSSVGRAASDTPVRDGGWKKSISREPALIYARKSRAEEDSSASGTRAASPGNVTRDSSASGVRAVSLRVVARDSSASSSSAASSRDVSRDSSACSSRAASSRGGARDNSSSEAEDSSSSEDDSDSDRQRMKDAKAQAEACLATLITAQERMKQAGRQIKKQVKERVEKKKRKEELRSIAAEKVKKEQANKVAAEA